MHKSLVILGAFFLFNISVSLLYSCNKGAYDDDGCGPFKSQYCATLKGIKVEPLRNLNSGYDTLGTEAQVRYYELVLSVTIQGEETVCRQGSVNPFMNSAIACTPPIPTLNFKGTISSVSITCDRDYDDTHAKGADLSAYFDIVENRDDLNEMEYTGNGITGNQKFRLTSSPKTNGTCTFTITYHLANGTDVQASCIPVSLTR